jgi:hypothetical protein
MGTRMVLLGAATFAALLVAAGVASADSILAGNTSQNLPIRVELAANGGIDHVKLTWRAPCSRHQPTFQNKTSLRVVDPEPTPFFGTGHYTVSRGGSIFQIRGRLDTQMATTAADQAANLVRWNGTFKVSINVRRDGKRIAKCRKSVTWSAAGPQP